MDKLAGRPAIGREVRITSAPVVLAPLASQQSELLLPTSEHSGRVHEAAELPLRPVARVYARSIPGLAQCGLLIRTVALVRQ